MKIELLSIVVLVIVVSLACMRQQNNYNTSFEVKNTIGVLDTTLGEEDYLTALKFMDNYMNFGDPLSFDSAKLYLNKAVRVKHVKACAYMGHLVLFDSFTDVLDTTYGLSLVQYAAEHNSESANFDMGVYMFCVGKYVEGEKYFLKADSLGDPFALYELSQCYSRGEPSVTVIGCQYNSVPKDREKELKYCKMAADKGNIDAQISMMYYYMNENDENAFKCAVLQVLENSDLELEQNASASDEIDMFLSENYGRAWNDTIKTWNCENK